MSINTIWSIDVGKSSLKAVKIHREQSSLEIVAVDKVDFEAGESGIDSITQSKEALRAFVSRNNIDCPVAVVHPSRSAFSRFIQLPPVDSKKLEEMIGYEAQQQIPFPIDEVIWDYHVSEADDASAEKEVGIFAVRKEAISDFMLDYESHDIPLELVSVGYIGLLNYVIFDLRPNRPVVVLDMGSDNTDLLIVDGKRFWFRSLPSAGKDFTQALMDKFKLDYSQAEELKTEGAKSEHAAKIFQVVQPLIRDLVNEINRSIGFYKSQAGEVKFEDLFLFGNGSKLLGLKNFLQEHLKFRVHVSKGFHRIRVNREANVGLLQRDFPAFSSSVGAAIQALGEGECEVNLLPQEQQEALEFRKKQKTVLIAAASLYLLIAWLFLSYGKKIENARAALDRTTIVQDLDETKDAIDALDGDRRNELEDRMMGLTAGVDDRLEALDAWLAIQSAFSAFDPGAVANGDDVLEIRSDGDVQSRKDELEAAQEELNASKWWLSLAGIRRVHLDERDQVVEKPAKDEKTWETYQASVTGIRYSVGTEIENTESARSEIKQRVLARLSDRMGSDYPEHLVNLTINSTDPPTIFTPNNDIKKTKRAATNEKDVFQGTLFEFTVTWIQPLPDRSSDAEDTDGDEEE